LSARIHRELETLELDGASKRPMTVGHSEARTIDITQELPGLNVGARITRLSLDVEASGAASVD
jgi:hypothetical protein